MKNRSVCTLLLGAMLSVGAMAQPTIDGVNIPGDFGGAPLASQTNFTGFGDHTGGVTWGSELDQLFAVVIGSVLYIGATGNLEDNSNNFHIYLDTVPGGSNSFSLTSGCFNCSAQGMSGVIFDTGFTPEYILGISNAGGTSYVDFHYLPGNTSCYVGSNVINPANGILTGGDPSCAPAGIEVAFNNTNEAGVTSDGGAPGDPSTATTGAEVAIPLSVINASPCGIRILVVCTGGAGTSSCNTFGTYLSNQMLPALNIGNPVAQFPNIAWSTCPDFPFTTFPFDFNIDAPGTQWVEISAPVPGDVNGDCCVDDADLAAVVFEFGGPETGAFGNTDLNNDGIVDDADLALVIFNFGTGCS